jgi:RimJ/RimL family protein N-acetyltransferase
VRWLNDAAVSRHLEVCSCGHTLASVTDYVRKTLADPNEHFFAMEDPDTGRHIGIIKLECFQAVHERGEISLFIGDTSRHGRGIGTETIVLVAEYAFGALGLTKLVSGCYSVNLASGRAFEKAGFHREAVLRNHYRCEDRWVDGWVYARFAPGRAPEAQAGNRVEEGACPPSP